MKKTKQIIKQINTLISIKKTIISNFGLDISQGIELESISSSIESNISRDENNINQKTRQEALFSIVAKHSKFDINTPKIKGYISKIEKSKRISQKMINDLFNNAGIDLKGKKRKEVEEEMNKILKNFNLKKQNKELIGIDFLEELTKSKLSESDTLAMLVEKHKLKDSKDLNNLLFSIRLNLINFLRNIKTELYFLSLPATTSNTPNIDKKIIRWSNNVKLKKRLSLSGLTLNEMSLFKVKYTINIKLFYSDLLVYNEYANLNRGIIHNKNQYKVFTGIFKFINNLDEWTETIYTQKGN